MATKKVVADHDFLIPEFKLTQVADINYEKLPIIRRSSDAVEVLSKYIAQKDLLTQISVNEFAFVLYLNKQNRVIGITNLSIGGLDSTLMDVRMVYSMAVKIGASSIIVAHNHPSQNLKPSEADIRMSNLMRDGGKSLTIQVLDFLIITSSSGYYSFGDEGMMEKGGMMARGGQTRPNINGEANVTDIVAPKNYRGPDGDMGIALIIRLDYGHFANEVNLTEDKKMMYEKFRQDKETLRQFDMEFKSYSSDREGPYIEIIKIDGNYATMKALNKYVNVFNVKNKYKLAKGGITEHGLRVGDTIVSEIDENTIVVENPTSGRRTINISTGHPMAKGGMSDKIVLLVKDKKGNVVLRTTSTNKAADYCGLHGRENFTVETLDGRRIMAKGGEIVDDEGNVMNLKVGDKVVNYRQTNPNQPKQELGGEGEIVAINGVMGKVFFESTNYEKWYPLKDLKKTSHNKMAKGGRMGFKALSEKVASHYAGKSVPTKYQPEYGKFYDADEAKTVGNKVAAKVYRLQQGK